MVRRRLTHPTKAVTFRISEALAAKFELLLLDPVANRSSYGKKSLIVEALLNKTIEAIKVGRNDINIADIVQHFGGRNEQTRPTEPVGL